MSFTLNGLLTTARLNVDYARLTLVETILTLLSLYVRVTKSQCHTIPSLRLASAWYCTTRLVNFCGVSSTSVSFDSGFHPYIQIRPFTNPMFGMRNSVFYRVWSAQGPSRRGNKPPLFRDVLLVFTLPHVLGWLVCEEILGKSSSKLFAHRWTLFLRWAVFMTQAHRKSRSLLSSPYWLFMTFK